MQSNTYWVYIHLKLSKMGKSGWYCVLLYTVLAAFNYGCEAGGELDNLPDGYYGKPWFDHDSVAGTACASNGCHGGDTNSTVKPTNHPETDDLCSACHTTNVWLPLILPFDHTHTSADCSTCHDDGIATGKNDTHMQTPDECDLCHTTSDWLEPNFNHDAVASIPCASSGCHDGASPRTYKPDTHPLTSNTCGACHGATAWLLLIFPTDHSQTIDACENCHNSQIAAGKSETHVVTSLACDSCHNTNSWASTP